jgi:hypothetical protein
LSTGTQNTNTKRNISIQAMSKPRHRKPDNLDREIRGLLNICRAINRVRKDLGPTMSTELDRITQDVFAAINSLIIDMLPDHFDQKQLSNYVLVK